MEIEKLYRREETGIDTSFLDHRFISLFFEFQARAYRNTTYQFARNSVETDGSKQHLELTTGHVIAHARKLRSFSN